MRADTIEKILKLCYTPRDKYEISLKTGIGVDTIKNYLGILISAGWLTRHPSQSQHNKMYYTTTTKGKERLA